MTTGEPATRVALRPARAEDLPLLMEWRNEADAVRFSQTRRPVAEPEHRAWFANRLAQANPRLWIAETDGDAAGQVRLDLAAGTATVSIAVGRDRRGRGLGLAILNAMVEAVAGDPDIQLLRAVTDPVNTASVVTFERAGFRRAGELDNGYVVLLRSPGVGVARGTTR